MQHIKRSREIIVKPDIARSWVRVHECDARLSRSHVGLHGLEQPPKLAAPNFYK
jgi:hypothetical protein